MKKPESVRDIMAFESLVLYLNDGLYQAEKLFKKHRVSYLPVVNDAKIVGILSIKDLVKICFVDRHDPYDFTIDTSIYSMFTLEQIMVCSPVLISDKATITEVAEIFLNVDHHVLPVLDDQDDLLGLVSTNDIIKYFLKK